MTFEKAIIIRDKTRLEQLIERFNSKAQARFYIESSGSDFGFYEAEHEQFYRSLDTVRESVTRHLKNKIIYRSFLPTFLFSEEDLIIVLGQDGLIANTAKYVGCLPMVGVNPDATRYDGILLKHTPDKLDVLLRKVLSGSFSTKSVTMARATLNDGQSLMAFNDFYIGANSHVSSRYTLDFMGERESQSSSGIIVSTGAGSTGWLSSVFNMANRIHSFYGNKNNVCGSKLSWDDDKLVFVLREPFRSKTSAINQVFGYITGQKKLIIESSMPANGVIFSDGIETDFLNFNSGSTVEIGLADEKAQLIV